MATLSGENPESFADSLLAEALEANQRALNETVEAAEEIPETGRTGTLADRLAGKIGLHGSRGGAGGSNLAERAGEVFPEGMLKKHSEGRL